MILFDSDHLTNLRYPENKGYAALRTRMQDSTDQMFATTIINVEEQLRGWLAHIHRQRDIHKQIASYERLSRVIEFFSEWEIVSLDEQAADEFTRLRKQGIRIGSQDLKIASIARVQNALLLSANLRDFRHVPGLRVANWLD